jgi:hypothetical protein
MITRENFDTWAAQRRAVHDASNDHVRQSIRYKVRARARAFGVEVPEWASAVSPTEITRRSWAARKQTSSVVSGPGMPSSPDEPKSERTPRRDHAAPQSARAPGKLTAKASQRENGRKASARRKAGRVPLTIPYGLEPCTPVVMPPALSAWRAAGVGRLVHVCRQGVVLDEVGQPQRQFPTVDAAIAALGR